MNKEIAIVILNYVQYISIKAGIEELKKRNYKIDIYCPNSDKDDGFSNMFNETKHFLEESGYKVYRSLKNKKYQVLLEPYPCMDINSKYKIRYRYGMISAKPNLVYIPYNYLMYDAVLCSGKYDSRFLVAFTKPIQVSNLKYINFVKKKHNYNKKVLLYLPTYGECSSIDEIIEELNNLRKNYYIIAKIHHGTTFLNNEKERIDKLKNNVDEFYDCFKDLSELLSFADVVLTDNSGAIFEALYTKTPVAVFCDDINKNKINNFNTTQYELYKLGVLPYTNSKTGILNILNKALSKENIEKQKNWSNENFYYSEKPEKDFANIIEKYLNDEVDDLYINFHKILSNNYYDIIRQRDILNYQLYNNENLLKKYEEDIKIKNQSLEKLYDYEKGKLYKIATKIYYLLSMIRRKK